MHNPGQSLLTCLPACLFYFISIYLFIYLFAIRYDMIPYDMKHKLIASMCLTIKAACPVLLLQIESQLLC